MKTKLGRWIVCGIPLSLTLAAVAADPPPVTPAPRSEDWWQGLHRRFAETAMRGNVDVLFIGDSITARFAGGCGNAVWQQRFGALKPANFGIEADRVEHILWRLQNGELDGIKPRAVVLLAGINNSWGDPNVDEETRGRYIANGIKAIVETIRAKLPEARILLMATFPRGDGLPASIRMSNAEIAKLDDGKFVRFLDINSRLAGPGGKVDKDIMPDGLHPSEKGYAIWGEAVESVLREWLKPGTAPSTKKPAVGTL